MVGELRDKCDIIVALSHLGYEPSKALAEEVNGIDIIISGHNAFQQKAAIKINKTLVVQTKYQGQYMGDLALSLNYNKEIETYKDLSRALVKPMPEDSQFVELVKNYKNQLRTMGVMKQSGARTQRVVRTRDYYAGEKLCFECHKEQHNQWSKTKHSMAFKALEEKDNSWNPECLPCHTTGYKVSNGFRNFQTTPNLIGVQCEECHGTKFNHVRSQQSKAAVFEPQKNNTPETEKNFSAICQKCHTKERDPDFNYAKYRKLIIH